MSTPTPELQKHLKKLYSLLPNEEAVASFHEYMTDLLTDLYHERMTEIVKEN